MGNNTAFRSQYLSPVQRPETRGTLFASHLEPQVIHICMQLQTAFTQNIKTCLPETVQALLTSPSEYSGKSWFQHAGFNRPN